MAFKVSKSSNPREAFTAIDWSNTAPEAEKLPRRNRSRRKIGALITVLALGVGGAVAGLVTGGGGSTRSSNTETSGAPQTVPESNGSTQPNTPTSPAPENITTTTVPSGSNLNLNVNLCNADNSVVQELMGYGDASCQGPLDGSVTGGPKVTVYRWTIGDPMNGGKEQAVEITNLKGTPYEGTPNDAQAAFKGAQGEQPYTTFSVGSYACALGQIDYDAICFIGPDVDTGVLGVGGVSMEQIKAVEKSTIEAITGASS